MTKETFIKAWAREMLSDNLDVMSEAEEFLFDFYNKVIAFETDTQQPSDSAGEECLYCTNGLEDRGNGDVADCSHCGGAGKLTRPTLNLPTEGEIDGLWKKHTKIIKSFNGGRRMMKISGFKAAIKELLNR